MNITTLLQSFVPSSARPLAPRPYLIPSIYLTCIVGSFLPSGLLRSSSVAIIVSYFIFQIPKATSGDVATDVLTPIQAVLVLLHWIDFYILHDPGEFQRGNEGETHSKNNGLYGAFKWYADLNTAMRGIGWSWQVKNVPKLGESKSTKWKFVRSRLGEAVIWYLLFDIATSLICHSPYGSSSPPNLWQDTFPKQILFAWLPGCLSYYGNVLQYSTFSALAVATGLFTPQDWPPLFGQLKDVCSVRDMWGKFWHQLLRRKLNISYTILTRYIPIKKGTLTSRYCQLYLAFATSAIIHAIGAMNIARADTARNMWPQLNYFLMQPLAITLEDFVIYQVSKFGIERSWKTEWLGRAWTFVWFTLSLRLTAEHHYQIGVLNVKQFPSLFDRMMSR